MLRGFSITVDGGGMGLFCFCDEGRKGSPKTFLQLAFERLTCQCLRCHLSPCCWIFLVLSYFSRRHIFSNRFFFHVFRISSPFAKQLTFEEAWPGRLPLVFQVVFDDEF